MGLGVWPMEKDVVERKITLYTEGNYQTDEQFTVGDKVLPVESGMSEVYQKY